MRAFERGQRVKAVILLAGMGSRLGELTASTPKSLLPMGNSNTLQQMVRKLTDCGIESIVVVCGHMQPVIERYLAETFPDVSITVVRNPDYRTTNTGYSLLVARGELDGETFIKLDGDVVFDETILSRLVSAPEGSSYVCLDRTAIDDEVIKVRCNADGTVAGIGNRIPVASAVGESIGIERIDRRSSGALFAKLAEMMDDPAMFQAYYEVAYDSLVQAGEPFRTVDITGSNWVEVDTQADYERAQHLFGTN